MVKGERGKNRKKIGVGLVGCVVCGWCKNRENR